MGTTEEAQGPSTPVSRARPTSANTALAGPRKRAGALLRSGRQFIGGTQNFQNTSSHVVDRPGAKEDGARSCPQIASCLRTGLCWKFGAEASIEGSKELCERNEAEGAQSISSICLLQLLQSDPIQSTPVHLHV